MNIDIQATRPACPSLRSIDQFRLEELDAHSDVGRHLTLCPSCQSRLEGLRREDEEFLNNRFVAREVDQLMKKSGRKTATSRRSTLVGLAAAAAIFTVVVMTAGPAGDSTGGTRRKGGLALDILLRHLDGTTELAMPGQTVRPEEAIMFRLTSTAPGYLAVIGLDSRGLASIYRGPAHSAALEQVTLDGSIVLDESLGPERIFAVLCATPPSAEKLLAAGQGALAKQPNPQLVDRLEIDCDQSSVWFEKVKP